eukprot:CAMPEP_0184486148 /NCGR_PEP_ID=MMETSP0113_2-20130426/7692_1 /TAXON_ID=91329 /ORGANISM="Norrisiella sphaerica, Strain BC52" /LENGTH=112 /DNA_ID=CAMNT_0026867891 /DNA_START=109 /DNA_END=447 /DNA_ORIENTATION=+
MGQKASAESLEHKPWLFRKLDALNAATSRQSAIRITIEDWIRWTQYTAFTTPAQRESKEEFTAIADKIDDTIDSKCYGNYNELTFCVVQKGVPQCKGLKAALDKCVRDNYEE